MDTKHNEEDLSDTSRFLQSWAWKREHRSDRARFKLPYQHQLVNKTTGEVIKLAIKQERFLAEGFASTVWDSSIVVAKYLEKIQGEIVGRSCLDLSAGCGLVGIVMARLGGRVTATDLAPNLRLLEENCSANGAASILVKEYSWGQPMEHSGYDLIIGCDLMYVEAAVDPLVQSLELLSKGDTTVLMAYGRNRFAESAFLSSTARTFEIEDVPNEDLDSKFQCIDVRVLRLRKHA